MMKYDPEELFVVAGEDFVPPEPNPIPHDEIIKRSMASVLANPEVYNAMKRLAET